MEPTPQATVITPSNKKATVGIQQVGDSSLVDTIQTVKAGGVPSNAQLEQTIEKTKSDIDQKLQEGNVSEKGVRLAKDTKGILNASENFLQQKNADELFQQTVVHAQQGSQTVGETAENIKREGELKGPEVAEIKEKAFDVYYLGRRLAREIISSRDFRVLLLEFGELVTEIIGKRAEEEGQRLKSAMKSDFVEGKISETLKEVRTVKEKVQSAKPGETSCNVEEQVTPVPKLTEEEKKELSTRFKKIVREIKKNPEYVMAVDCLLDLIDQLKVKAKHAVQFAQGAKEEVKQDENVQLLRNDVRHIVERFAGEKRLDILLNEIDILFESLRSDPWANQFWNELTLFLRDSVRNPESLDADVARHRFGRLLDLSRATFNDPRYEYHVRQILAETQGILNCIQYDPATEQLIGSLKKFAKDLVLDWKGEPSVGAISDSISGLREVLFPVVIEQLQHIPVAKIEGSNKKYDYVLDNIHFSAYDILPEHVKLELFSKVDVALKEGPRTDKANARIDLDLQHINTHLKDLRFAFRRKEFPKMEDQGIADVDIVGGGTVIHIGWEIVGGKEVPMRFIISEVRCNIENMKITIKEAKHNVLDAMITKLWNKKLKGILEDEIRFNLRFLGNRIADVFNDAVYNFHSTFSNVNMISFQQ